MLHRKFWLRGPASADELISADKGLCGCNVILNLCYVTASLKATTNPGKQYLVCSVCHSFVGGCANKCVCACVCMRVHVHMCVHA